MRLPAALLLLLLASASVAAAPSPEQIVEDAQAAVGQVRDDPEGSAKDPWALVEGFLGEEEADPAPPEREDGFADRFGASFRSGLGAWSAGAALLGLVTAGGYALVTRHISPREALKNPQRAMIYGFVRGKPGVHLKELSEGFAMKSSSILWHMRKLEAADLVRTERANGFRVFYPVEGGVQAKLVGRGVAALQNSNARNVYLQVQKAPGRSAIEISRRLALKAGTVRWHLRKMREYGLVDEMKRSDSSLFYPTPIGGLALESMEGRA